MEGKKKFLLTSLSTNPRDLPPPPLLDFSRLMWTSAAWKPDGRLLESACSTLTASLQKVPLKNILQVGSASEHARIRLSGNIKYPKELKGKTQNGDFEHIYHQVKCSIGETHPGICFCFVFGFQKWSPTCRWRPKIRKSITV